MTSKFFSGFIYLMPQMPTDAESSRHANIALAELQHWPFELT